MNAATLAAHMAILAIGIPEVPLFPRAVQRSLLSL